MNFLYIMIEPLHINEFIKIHMKNVESCTFSGFTWLWGIRARKGR